MDESVLIILINNTYWRQKKYKKSFVVLVCVLIASSFLLKGQDQQGLWNRAMQENNIESRYQLLKEYDTTYGQISDKNSKFLYLNLSFISFQIKKYSETITYGEKAVAYKDDIKELNVLQLYQVLADAYRVTKMDYDKSIQFATGMVTLAKKIKNDTNVSINMDKKYIAVGLRIKSRALFAKGKDNPEDLKMATNAAIEAYQFDSSRDTARLIYNLSVNLANKKMFAESIQALVKILDSENPNLKYLEKLATIYSKKGDKVKAVEYLEWAYKIRRKAKIAYNIGVLTQSSNKEKAVQYLAEAFQFQEGKYSTKAKKLLEHLVFNILYQDKTAEEKEAKYKQILQAAKQRIETDLSD